MDLDRCLDCGSILDDYEFRRDCRRCQQEWYDKNAAGWKKRVLSEYELDYKSNWLQQKTTYVYTFETDFTWSSLKKLQPKNPHNLKNICFPDQSIYSIQGPCINTHTIHIGIP